MRIISITILLLIWSCTFFNEPDRCDPPTINHVSPICEFNVNDLTDCINYCEEINMAFTCSNTFKIGCGAGVEDCTFACFDK